MAAPELSIVICTANRPEELRAALAAVNRLTLPSDMAEIVVVDNGAGSATKAVVDVCGIGSPFACQYLRLETPGLAEARNAGARAARGAIVAYLDDDAAPEPRWGRAVLDAFAAHPEAEALGGRTRLVFSAAAPDWLGPEHRRFLAEYDLGGWERFVESKDELPFGVNMAFRAQALSGPEPFDIRLGRRGRVLLSGEEAALLRRMLRRGAKILYSPQAAVSHRVRADRLGDRYFIDRFYWQGATEARMDRMDYGLPRRLWRLATRAALALKIRASAWLARLAGDSARQRLMRQFAAYPRGYWREFFRRAEAGGKAVSSKTSK